MGNWCRRILFVISILGLSWLGMMATHEFGHVVAAKLTGGTVVRVVLHPATISRTDVLPNPSPLAVAWAGPVLGCLIPVLVTLAARRLTTISRSESKEQERVSSHEWLDKKPPDRSPGIDQPVRIARAPQRLKMNSLIQFFAGFCCLANGAYLGVGVFDRVGDADEILKAGTSSWLLIVFGLVASVSGMALWHQLGSPFAILQSREELDPWLVRGLVVTLLLVLIVECVLSPI